MGKKKYAAFIKSSIKKQEIEIENKETEETSTNSPFFIDDTGHVTLDSISNSREWFYGKTIDDFAEILTNFGYTFFKRGSINEDEGSKAEILVITNTSKERNIAQVQVSPGSSRHGDVPYVKISTIDIGKIKVIDSTEEKYRTDGKERAKILFRREK